MTGDERRGERYTNANIGKVRSTVSPATECVPASHSYFPAAKTLEPAVLLTLRGGRAMAPSPRKLAYTIVSCSGEVRHHCLSSSLKTSETAQSISIYFSHQLRCRLQRMIRDQPYLSIHIARCCHSSCRTLHTLPPISFQNIHKHQGGILLGEHVFHFLARSVPPS